MNAPLPMKLRSKHPLQRKQRPGPQVKVDAGDQTLADAGLVLDAMDDGRLEPSRDARASWKDQLGQLKRTLTAEQERLLAYRVQTLGCVDARNLLVEKNLGLVHVVLRNANRQVYGEDLVQEARLGLLRAVETFNPTMGIRFSTYAAHWIAARVGRYRQKQQKEDVPVRIDVHVKGQFKDDEASGMFFIDEQGKRVRKRATVARLDEPVKGEDGETTLGEFTANGEPSQEDTLILNEGQERVRAAMEDVLKCFGKHERMRALARTVAYERMLAIEPKRLDALGDAHGYSRETVRQVEKQLFKGLVKRLRNEAEAVGAPSLSRSSPSTEENRKHGKRSTYVMGCRCDECRRASRDYRRSRLARGEK